MSQVLSRRGEASGLHPEGRGLSVVAVRALPWLGAGALGVAAGNPHGVRVALFVPLALIALALAQRSPRAVIIGTFCLLPVLGLIRRLVAGASGPTSSDPLLLVVPAAVGVLTLVVARRRPFARPTAVTKAVLALCALCVVEAFNPLQGNVLVGLSGLLFVLVPMLWFWIGRTLVGDLLLKRLLYIVAGLAIPAAIYGLVQTLVGLPSFDKTYVAATLSRLHSLDVGGAIRAFGPLTSGFEYAAYLGCGLLIWYVLAMRSRWRLMALPALVLLGYALFLESSRAVVLLLLVGLVLVTAARFRIPLSRALVVGMVLVAALSFALSHVSSSASSTTGTGALVQHQVAGLANPLNPKDSTLRTHLDEILNGLRLTALNPIGRGPGAVNLGAVKYGGTVSATESDPSNAGVALGVPGLLCYLLLAIVGFRTAYRRAAKRRDICSLAALGILAVLGFQWLNGGQYAVAPLPWLVLGWLDAPRADEDGTSGRAIVASRSWSGLGKVLGRRGRSIVAVAAIVSLVAFATSLAETPLYASTAKILVATGASANPFGTTIGQATSVPDIATELEALQGPAVQAAVSRQLGSAPPVSVSQVGQSQVISVMAESSQPGPAAAIANAYARAYVSYRQTTGLSQLASVAKQVSAQIDGTRKQIDALSVQLSNPSSAQSAAAGAARATQDDLVGQQLSLQQKLASLQLQELLVRQGDRGATVVIPAAAALRAVSPDPVRSVALGAGVGLLFGVGLALLAEYLGDSIESVEDLDRCRGDLPVLGVIPAARVRRRPWHSVAPQRGPQSSSFYQGLMTSLQLIGLDRPLRSIEVVSPQAGDGKTTTVASLAMLMAGAGRRVVVVGGDLRRPRVQECFGLGNAVGLTSVLVGDVPISRAIQQVPGVSDISVLAAGPIPPNPSELLAGQRIGEILVAVSSLADVVLVDTPPALAATDAALISERVDATVIVVSAGRTTRDQLARTIEAMQRVRAPLVGVVLNGLVTRRASARRTDPLAGAAYEVPLRSERHVSRSRHVRPPEPVTPIPLSSRR